MVYRQDLGKHDSRFDPQNFQKLLVTITYILLRNAKSKEYQYIYFTFLSGLPRKLSFDAVLLIPNLKCLKSEGTSLTSSTNFI